MSSEIVVDEPLVVALPRSHRLVARRHLPLCELANETFILPPKDAVPVFHDVVLKACRDAGFVPRSTDEADHLHLVLGMVTAGAAVALVPASARRMERRRVAYRQLKPPPDNLQIALAWRRADKSPALAEFIDFMRRTLPARQSGAR